MGNCFGQPKRYPLNEIRTGISIQRQIYSDRLQSSKDKEERMDAKKKLEQLKKRLSQVTDIRHRKGGGEFLDKLSDEDIASLWNIDDERAANAIICRFFETKDAFV